MCACQPTGSESSNYVQVTTWPTRCCQCCWGHPCLWVACWGLSWTTSRQVSTPFCPLKAVIVGGVAVAATVELVVAAVIVFVVFVVVDIIVAATAAAEMEEIVVVAAIIVAILLPLLFTTLQVFQKLVTSDYVSQI